MKKFIDFSFNKINYLALVVLILSVVWAKVFNVVEIKENTIYENIAVIPLLGGIFLCLKSKSHKIFFRFIALVLFLTIAREFSYGRVPFCAIEGSAGHDFYPWKHYKYGFLANIFVGIYIFLSFLYAVINKIWIDLSEIIKKVQIPIWDFLSVFVCILIQEIYEHQFENTVVEEIAEFVIYTLTFCIVWIYYKKVKNTTNI